MSGLLVRARGAVLLSALLVAVALAPVAARLELRTDLASLLPTRSPAAQAYRVFLDRFGGLERVFVVVRSGAADPGSSPPESVARAALLLEERLEREPLLGGVSAGPSARDEAFVLDDLLPGAIWFVPSEELEAARSRLTPEAVERRVEELRRLVTGPMAAIEGRLARADPLALRELAGLEIEGGGLRVDPLSSLFVSADGGSVLMILQPRAGELDTSYGRELDRALRGHFEAVSAAIATDAAGTGAASGAASGSVEILAVGGPLYAAWDEALFRRDLVRAVGASALSTLGVLWWAYAGATIVVSAAATLAFALLLTAASLGLLFPAGFGALSLGFSAALVGLGVDFVIHLGTRIREALEGGLELAEAGASTLRSAGPAIVAAAVSSAAGFAVLGLADLPLLRELGALLSFGIASLVVASFLVGLPLVLWLEGRFRRPARRSLPWRLAGAMVDGLAATAARRPATVLVVATVAAAAALLGLPRLEVSGDAAALRPVGHPAAAAERVLSEDFGLGPDTAQVLVRGVAAADALRGARTATETLRRALPEAEVRSPSDVLLPADASMARCPLLPRQELLRAADLLEAALPRRGLDPAAFEPGLRGLRAASRCQSPFEPEDAPEWARALLSAPEEAAPGAPAWAAITVRGDAAELERLAALFGAGELDSPDDPSTAVSLASAKLFGGELESLALRDARRLGLLALIAVVAVAGVAVRGSLRLLLAALLPVDRKSVV